MKDKEIQFIGKITAGITHEVNNVFASVREISGLLTDILSLTSDESFKHKEKFNTSLEKILNQENRGVKLISQLNKFAHLPDSQSSEIDINENIQHLIFLTERFGRVKSIQLQMQPAEQEKKVVSNPFYLQMALFYCVEYFLNNLKAGGKIFFNHYNNQNNYSINISAEGEVFNLQKLFNDPSSMELSNLSKTLEVLDAAHEFDKTNKSVKIKLSIEK
ncbi:MAG: hypothetical protein KJN64_03160 [Ignavibacteria bacterium]|nr:hypothetical protein [Ignavibacteria bacterium]MBT8391261.1 hypothetical protein [Ignavibacteria bacterium]NNL21682.1 hypothetical protein [Ignavibacteriaceae bacterium]